MAQTGESTNIYMPKDQKPIVEELAKKEYRSFSQMCAVLIARGIEATQQQSQPQAQA